MIFAFISVAHLAQTDGTGHILQFAIAVGRAGQAIQRVVGDIEFHHAAPDIGQTLVLRADLHALGDRRGAGSRQTPAALDLDQTEPA